MSEQVTVYGWLLHRDGDELLVAIAGCTTWVISVSGGYRNAPSIRERLPTQRFDALDTERALLQAAEHTDYWTGANFGYWVSVEPVPVHNIPAATVIEDGSAAWIEAHHPAKTRV